MLTYLLTCCFNFRCLLNILVNSRRFLSKQVLWTEAAFSACFDMALTWPSFTIELTSGVDVFVHMCGQKRTLRGTIVTIFSHTTRDVSVFVKCDTIFQFFFWKLPQIQTSKFRKVVRRHNEGMVVGIIQVLLPIYFSFQQWNFFWKSVKNWESYCHEFGVLLFWDTVYNNMKLVH